MIRLIVILLAAWLAAPRADAENISGGGGGGGGGSSPSFSGTVTMPDSSAWNSSGLNVVPAGSATAPNINFNTCGPPGVGSACGFYAPAAGQLGITTAGTIALDYGISATGVWTFSNSLTVTTGQVSGNRFLVTGAALPVNGMYRPSLNNVGIAANTALVANFNASGVQVTGTLTASAIVSNTGVQSGYLCYSTTGGVITYDQTNTCLVSSGRYKQNIETANAGLAEVLALHPVSFEYKPEYHLALGPHLGLIAEEVAQVDDRLVAFNPDGDARGVKYFEVVAVLVKAIQEQQAEIEALRAR